ncbi:MAG: hypothetical protein EP350_06360 [Alphaproteobacteria bacterium]|nr:MAG: hypothetical protein EP350_06360 [Alphaproteobacteria bacterium]
MRAPLGAIVLALAAATAGQAQETVPHAVAWKAIAEDSGRVRDLAGLQELAAAFPDSGSMRLRLLNAQLEAGERDALLETLAWLKARGYVFSKGAQQQIPKLVGADYAERAVALLIPEVYVVETSEVIETTPAEAGLTESVLRDPIDDRLVITSVSHRGVLGKKPHAGWDGFAIEGAANISGIARSPDSQIIWLGAGHIDGAEPDGSFTGLVGLTRVGREVIKIAAPDGVSISDLTVGSDGTIYGSDPIGGGVYLAAPDDKEMQALLPLGTFRSPQGLAVSKDGGHLYVSDYRYGIAMVDLENGEVSRLTTNLDLILDGVDGMWRYNNELIVVQNGTSPMRIGSLVLSEDGRSVVEYRLLEQAHSEWSEPLSGSLDGDALLYIGNGQWDRFVKGEPAQDKPTLPTQIRRLLLY